MLYGNYTEAVHTCMYMCASHMNRCGREVGRGWYYKGILIDDLKMKEDTSLMFALIRGS